MIGELTAFGVSFEVCDFDLALHINVLAAEGDVVGAPDIAAVTADRQITEFVRRDVAGDNIHIFVDTDAAVDGDVLRNDVAAEDDVSTIQINGLGAVCGTEIAYHHGFGCNRRCSAFINVCRINAREVEGFRDGHVVVKIDSFGISGEMVEGGGAIEINVIGLDGEVAGIGGDAGGGSGRIGCALDGAVEDDVSTGGDEIGALDVDGASREGGIDAGGDFSGGEVDRAAVIAIAARRQGAFGRGIDKVEDAVAEDVEFARADLGDGERVGDVCGNDHVAIHDGVGIAREADVR